MQPADLVHFRRSTAVALSPDGAHIVYCEERPSLRIDGYTSQLWRMRVDGTEASRLTGGLRDVAPQFSPDGTWLAFLRVADGASQVHLMSTSGGEPFAVTDQKLGVEQFVWAPDSARIAFVSRQPAAGRYGTVEGVGPDGEPARMLADPRFRSDGTPGYSYDRPAQVFALAVPGMVPAPQLKALDTDGYALEPESDNDPVVQATRLTNDNQSYGALAFSEDGTRVFAVTMSDRLVLPSRVVAIAVDGSGSIDVVVSEDAHLSVGPLVAHEGALWFTGADLGETGRAFAGTSGVLYRVALDASAPVALTTHEDGDFTDAPLIVSGAGVVTVDRTRGTAQLVAYADATGLVRLTDGDHEVRSVAANGDTIVVGAATPTANDEVMVLRDGALVPVTDLSAGLRERGIRVPVALESTSTDGHTVHGWVVLPEGEGPHPAILMIHGGPHAQYTSSLFDETQVLVDAGYAVVLCNPRGSAGYGQAHAQAIVGRMGTDDADDVLRFLETAVETFSAIDGDRLGVMGGSYGGYLTAWLIGHDHRFKGAIVERGFLDPFSFAAISDIGWFFGQEYVGEDPDRMRAQSPMEVVANVQTPTFVIHSERDYRCPLEAAERYVFELRRAGVEHQFLVFPGESHGLSRNGRPRHRLQRFQEILAWWARYLPTPTSA